MIKLDSNNKVLLVDNDALFSLNLTHQIEELGYIVYRSSDVVEAFALLSQYRPDIIVCNIDIPVIDGFAFLQLVRSSKDHSNIIFILIASELKAEFLRKGMLIGADDYLVKPFEGSDLDLAIKVRVSRIETVKSNLEIQTITMLKNSLSTIPCSLTKRESEVFALIAYSLSNKEIAERLKISPKTVMNHRQKIMDKLGISGNGTLYEYAKKMKNQDFNSGNIDIS